MPYWKYGDPMPPLQFRGQPDQPDEKSEARCVCGHLESDHNDTACLDDPERLRDALVEIRELLDVQSNAFLRRRIERITGDVLVSCQVRGCKCLKFVEAEPDLGAD